MDANDWRDGVRVVRGKTLQEAMAAKGGRATAVDFESGGERGAWIGTVRLEPLGTTRIRSKPSSSWWSVATTNGSP
jgi:hypothetical protein